MSFGQHVAPVQLPEVRIARPHHRPLHVARAPVVRRHRQVPVPELVVQILHIARICLRRLLRIEALIEVRIARKPVHALERHELPHAARARVRVQRLRLEARLRHRQVDQVLRNALLPQVLRDHLLVFARAFQRAQQMRVPRRRVREVVDEPRHIVVHHQRKVRLRRLQLLLHLRRQLRVGRKGHLVGGIQRRRLDWRAEPRALFQRRHLQRVDRIQQVLELVRELRIVLHIHLAGQHQIDRHVEVGTRGLQPPAAIVRHAAAIVPLGLLDQLLHPLRSRSKLVGLRLRHRRSRSRHRRRSGDRRRSCLRRNPARSARLPLRTARQQHQRHARSRHRPPPRPAHHPHPLVVSIKNLSRSFVRKRSVNCKRSAHCKTFAEHFTLRSYDLRHAPGNAQFALRDRSLRDPAHAMPAAQW